MDKKRVLVLLPIIVILVLSGILFLYSYQETEKVTNYLTGSKKTAILEQVTDQVAINTKLERISNEKKYTFESPYIELNPYKISPLSAIIIFNTKEEKEVKVYINDKYVTTVTKSKKHIIPIYGLYEDYDNVIKLVIDKEEKSFNITTEKSNIEYPLEVEYKAATINDEELYFTVASYKTYLTAWDIEGKLRFYLTVDNRMDVEWLKNGHFLIGTSEGQFAENFCSFVEMDYLGKIYNYYTPEHGYSFEFQVLKNGNYMMGGGNNPVYITEQVIHEVNPRDGKTVSSLNVASVIKNIDPNFDSKYLGQKAIRNSFYYNEDTNELLLSFRGWDAILSINYQTKELNYIFTDPANELFKNDVWKEYLVVLDSGRYPLGEHSVIMTSEGFVGFFNNGYNRLHGFENGGNDLVSYYKNNYSSMEIYEIKDKRAKLVFDYDANKKYFSHQYGGLRELSNGNYLVDFGYVLKDDYRNSSKGKLSEAEASPDNIYAEIIEVNKSGKVVFKAKSEEGKYRAFKHNLYNDVTDNIELASLYIFNNVKEDNLKESNYRSIDLDSAEKWIYTVDFTKNTFVTNYGILEDDNIDLYLVNKIGDIYILNYKDKNNKTLKRIFNINIPNGEYGLYINLNGRIYKTNFVYKF